jgi:hypothetical protein
LRLLEDGTRVADGRLADGVVLARTRDGDADDRAHDGKHHAERRDLAGLLATDLAVGHGLTVDDDAHLLRACGGLASGERVRLLLLAPLLFLGGSGLLRLDHGRGFDFGLGGAQHGARHAADAGRRWHHPTEVRGRGDVATARLHGAGGDSPAQTGLQVLDFTWLIRVV